MKKNMFVICCLLLMFVITGCSFDDKFSSKEEVIYRVKLSLPNAEFVRLEKKAPDPDDWHDGGSNTYYFNNNGLEFKVKNSLSRGMFSFSPFESSFSDTYMKNLWITKCTELENLFNQYPEIENVFDTEYGAIYFTPENSQDFDDLNKFLDEYLNILKEYLPHDNGLIDSSISIAITTKLSIPETDPAGLSEKMSISKPLYIETLEEIKNNSIKELKDKYLKNVELGYIEVNTINN